MNIHEAFVNTKVHVKNNSPEIIIFPVIVTNTQYAVTDL